MFVNNEYEMVQNFQKNKILFSSDLLQKAFYRNFITDNLWGNASAYQMTLPSIVVDISFDFNITKSEMEYKNDHILKLSKNCNIFPYITYN